MSLDFFSPSEGSEGVSGTALEELKKRMQAASAQIAAIKKEEGKQKQKDDKLLKILIAFIKSSHKKELAYLITKVLALNVPSSFILAIILLGNKEVEDAVANDMLRITNNNTNSTTETSKESQAGLIVFRENESLPLNFRIELENWLKNLMIQAEENPQKVIKTAYIHIIDWENEDRHGKKIIAPEIIDLMAYVFQDFATENGQNQNTAQSRNFVSFIIKGILEKTEENLKNRKNLQ